MRLATIMANSAMSTAMKHAQSKPNEAGLAVRLGKFLAVSLLYNSALAIFYTVIVELRPALSVPH